MLEGLRDRRIEGLSDIPVAVSVSQPSTLNPRTSFVAVALLLLCAGGCEYDVQPLKGAEGRTLVYAAVGRLGAPNAGIILTSLGAVVVDPPLSPELGQRLNLDALRRSKVFWDEKHRRTGERARTLAPPVLYVLNTTYRASHTFGNQVFLNCADFVATEKAGRHLADRLEVRRMRELLASEFKVPGLEDHAVTEATLTVEGPLTLHTPEVEVKFIPVGDCVGEGDAVVYLPQQKVLFAGDLALVGFVPYFQGRTLTARNWIAALKRLEAAMEEDVVVVPGHGQLGGKELLTQQREFLEALLAAVNAAVTAGQKVEQAMSAVKLPTYARWQKYDEWFPENVRLVYQELSAPAGSQAATPTGGGMAGPAAIEQPDRYRDR